MQRRLLIVLLVFVAGFGAGYGVTWLLVDSPRQNPEPPSGAQANAVPHPSPAAPALPPTTDAVTPEVTADADAVVAPLPDSVLAPAADVGGAAKTDAGPSAEVAAAPDAGSTAATPVKAAWEACHMQVCRLDFGKISGGISIREGTLEHGQKVDWDRDFAKADKVGTLEAGRHVQVEVLAIGVEGSEPTAAYILRKTKRHEIRGVIALRIGDKQLHLEPLGK